MNTGEPVVVSLDLQVELEGWRDPDTWSCLRRGADFPPEAFPGSQVFRDALLEVVEHAARGQCHHSIVVTGRPGSPDRTLHPADVRVSAILDGPLRALATCDVPVDGGLMEIEVAAQMPLVRIVEMHLIAAAIVETKPSDENVVLRGWENVVAFEVELPPVTGDSLLGFLRAHADVPRRWLWRMLRADVSYDDASRLVATHTDEEVEAILDDLLGLLD